jgi:hypothetical protein
VPQFQLLPGAKGLDFPGGTSLKADRRGRITVSDEQAAAIRGSAAKRRYDAIIEVAPMRHVSTPGEATCGCGFAYWPWQKSCPRCGADLEEK